MQRARLAAGLIQPPFACAIRILNGEAGRIKARSTKRLFGEPTGWSEIVYPTVERVFCRGSGCKPGCRPFRAGPDIRRVSRAQPAGRPSCRRRARHPHENVTTSRPGNVLVQTSCPVFGRRIPVFHPIQSLSLDARGEKANGFPASTAMDLKARSLVRDGDCGWCNWQGSFANGFLG